MQGRPPLCLPAGQDFAASLVLVFWLLMRRTVGAKLEDDVDDTCKRRSPHWTVRGTTWSTTPRPIGGTAEGEPQPTPLAEAPKAFRPWCLPPSSWAILPANPIAIVGSVPGWSGALWSGPPWSGATWGIRTENRRNLEEIEKNHRHNPTRAIGLVAVKYLYSLPPPCPG